MPKYQLWYIHLFSLVQLNRDARAIVPDTDFVCSLYGTENDWDSFVGRASQGSKPWHNKAAAYLYNNSISRDANSDSLRQACSNTGPKTFE